MSQILAKTKEELLAEIIKGLSALIAENENYLSPDTQKIANDLKAQLNAFSSKDPVAVDLDKFRSNLESLRDKIGQEGNKISVDDIPENNKKILDAHDGPKGKSDGGLIKSIAELMSNYAQQVLLSLTYAAGQSFITAGISKLLGNQPRIVSTNEDEYVFNSNEMNAAKDKAKDDYVRFQDYMNTVRAYNFNLLQRWRVEFSDRKFFNSTDKLLFSHYATEVVLPFPSITLGTINYGRYIKDVQSMTNRPISISYLIDLNMHIANKFNYILSSMGDPDTGILGYKDDYVIDKLVIMVENNNLGIVLKYIFHDLVIADMNEITVRQENNEVQLLNLTLDYDYKKVIVGKKDRDNIVADKAASLLDVLDTKKDFGFIVNPDGAPIDQ
jgi:hypothetical protein